MTIRLVLCGAWCLSILAASSVASAGGWHNPVTRRLGIGYSDGYHSHEGCPSEKIGGWKQHSAWRGDSESYGYAGYREQASPFADQHQSHAPRPVYSAPSYGAPSYSPVIEDGSFSGELPAEPTPAKPIPPIAPTIPADPSVPMRNGHSEARLPSSLFPLAPIR